ncbi:hypothetical protein CC86DRAFT_400598 [Ophiobolus disseminans]|uniref:Uncharacterized protein n=1 Tax=Ophiobolus disseminans TaxID=1469910 RepID=A0A6A7ALL7_9PLEO|nr:hypothetical protein CC86DRAFT_400598 [Ophiobolus disseminans]
MRLKFWSNKSQPFHRLATADSEDDEETSEPEREIPRRDMWFWAALIMVMLALSIVNAAVGYFYGTRAAHRFDRKKQEEGGSSQYGLLEPAGNWSTHMIWNTTFSHLPKSHVQNAWERLYPLGQGHIEHPILCPDGTKTLAVYHQLHCLQAIDLYYSKQLHTNFNSSRERTFNAHIHHCFDYLRQAIICAADTNLEPFDSRFYGVQTAIPKKCRDIREVNKFAERYRSSQLATPDFAQTLDYIRGFEVDAYGGGR